MSSCIGQPTRNLLKCHHDTSSLVSLLLARLSICLYRYESLFFMDSAFPLRTCVGFHLRSRPQPHVCRSTCRQASFPSLERFHYIQSLHVDSNYKAKDTRNTKLLQFRVERKGYTHQTTLCRLFYLDKEKNASNASYRYLAHYP